MIASINYPLHDRNLLAKAVQWLQRGDQLALITLVNVEGSAPYPLGAQMLVNHNGDFCGQITGGCAESDLAQQAVTCIGSGSNSTQRYGLNSPYFDIQLPCGSGIDVVIDVLGSQTEYQELVAELGARQVVTQTLAMEHGEFLKTYLPNERLCLFGQGPILNSLAQLALASGFEVVCVVQDVQSLDGLNDLGIAASLLADIKGDFRGGFIDHCDAYTAVVSLFHEHDYETEILSAALQTNAFYIGALGSQRTHAVRLQNLRKALEEHGLDNNALARIFGPVGLDINAETPAQIAISILAQIIEKMPKAKRSD